MKRCITVMVIGKRYENIFVKKREMFESYAKRCKAELAIIDKAPDQEMKRNLLCQKILIPSQMIKYEECLYLDLDVFISDAAPDIFLNLPEDYGFSAVLDDRTSDQFRLHWVRHKSVLSESTQTYFHTRGFPLNNDFSGSINAGVFLFKPKVVGRLFKEYYFNDDEARHWLSYEEGPLAYLSQSNNLFYPLDWRFNWQFQYALHSCKEGIQVARLARSFPLRLFGKIAGQEAKQKYMIRFYKPLVPKLLEQCHILHFAGGYDPELYANE